MIKHFCDHCDAVVDPMVMAFVAVKPRTRDKAGPAYRLRYQPESDQFGAELCEKCTDTLVSFLTNASETALAVKG